MLDAHSVGDEKVADEASMTPPKEPFRAHDCRALLPPPLHEFTRAFWKRSGEHVVGIIPKALILQARVRRFVSLFGPAAAESFEPVIVHARVVEGFRECFPVKMRIFS